MVAAPIYSCTNSVLWFTFATLLPTFVICRLSDDSYFDRCEVISYRGFDLHFSDV